jgi:hypothetical protein
MAFPSNKITVSFWKAAGVEDTIDKDKREALMLYMIKDKRGNGTRWEKLLYSGSRSNGLAFFCYL